MTKAIQRGLLSIYAEAATPSLAEISRAFSELQTTFATFRTENDKRIEDIKKGNDDALQALKVDNINADVQKMQKTLDDLMLRYSSAQMGVGGKTIRDPEYTDAFRAHMRKGDINAAMQKGTATEGGYLAPIEWDRTITSKLVEISPMRQICNSITISSAGFSKLFNKGGTGSGWVGETDQRPNTGTPQFAQLTYTPMELYANPAATQQLLDDAEIDLEAWLADEVQTEFAKQEGAAFVSGDSTKQPKGILTYVTGGSNAAEHPFGEIKSVSSGDANTIKGDSILDVVYAVPGQLKANARFIMNNDAQLAIRKLKDGQGNYLWQPSYVAGQAATLAGYPITEVPDMPDVAAGATPMLFGDFKRGYLIVNRIGVRVLRDPYTNKPFVQFYTTMRVGGGLLNPEPLRALTVGA